jgi:hypothetical protein
MITELTHQRDVVRDLISDNVSNQTDFRWLYHLRYSYHPEAPQLTEKLMISLCDSTYYYGFEYLGLGERSVQTPLTGKAYFTMTQALHFRMGALCAQLGRFVLVFNCDEKFDFMRWAACSANFVRLEHGVVLTNLIDWKKASCPLCRNKFLESSSLRCKRKCNNQPADLPKN